MQVTFRNKCSKNSSVIATERRLSAHSAVAGAAMFGSLCKHTTQLYLKRPKKKKKPGSPSSPPAARGPRQQGTLLAVNRLRVCLRQPERLDWTKPERVDWWRSGSHQGLQIITTGDKPHVARRLSPWRQTFTNQST